MDISDVKANKFYKVKLRVWAHEDFGTDCICVIKCTKIQDFKHKCGYNVYHFKSFFGEIVIDDARYPDNYYHYFKEIYCEITDRALCDTSIKFIDDTHYEKLVNKGVYKIFEIK